MSRSSESSVRDEAPQERAASPETGRVIRTVTCHEESATIFLDLMGKFSVKCIKVQGKKGLISPQSFVGRCKKVKSSYNCGYRDLFIDGSRMAGPGAYRFPAGLEPHFRTCACVICLPTSKNPQPVKYLSDYVHDREFREYAQPDEAAAFPVEHQDLAAPLVRSWKGLQKMQLDVVNVLNTAMDLMAAVLLSLKHRPEDTAVSTAEHTHTTKNDEKKKEKYEVQSKQTLKKTKPRKPGKKNEQAAENKQSKEKEQAIDDNEETKKKATEKECAGCEKKNCTYYCECKSVFYCGPKCQTSNWDIHRKSTAHIMHEKEKKKQKELLLLQKEEQGEKKLDEDQN